MFDREPAFLRSIRPAVNVIKSDPPILKCIVSSVSAVILVSASASKINSCAFKSKEPPSRTKVFDP